MALERGERGGAESGPKDSPSMLELKSLDFTRLLQVPGLLQLFVSLKLFEPSILRLEHLMLRTQDAVVALKS